MSHLIPQAEGTLYMNTAMAEIVELTAFGLALDWARAWSRSAC